MRSASRRIVLGWAAALLLLSAPGRAAEEASVEKLLADVAAYRDGQSAKALYGLDAVVARASRDPKQARPLARRLAKLLEDPKVSREAKIFVCRKLHLIAGPEQVPVLARLLGDPELSHMARYVLQAMDDPAVDPALRQALGRLEGKLLIGLVNTIGERRDREATGALAKLLGDRDKAIATASATALGKIGGARAAAAIAAARAEAKGRLRADLTQAWLACADSLRREGSTQEAAGVFQTLLARSEPHHVRVAALRGRVATMEPKEAASLLLLTALGDDATMRTAAVSLLAGMRDPAVGRVMARLLVHDDPAVQRAAVDALAARGVRTALWPLARLAERGADPGVRLAAVRALERLGDASVAGLLATLAAADEGALRDAARASLMGLRGKGVDDAILAAVKDADEGVRIELLRALRDRRATAFAEPIAEIAAADRSAAVRRQCYSVLADLAGGEQLGRLVALLLRGRDTAARGTAERAVLAVARRVEAPAERLQPVLAAHASAAGAARATTVRLLGRLGGARALEAVLGDVGHRDAAVAEAALRALANWPDDSAIPALVGILKAPGDAARRILALRGYIRLAGASPERPAERTVGMYEFALRAASRPEEKRLVLAGLAAVSHPAALKLAEQCLGDPALEAEAEQAIRKIKLTLSKPIPSASHNLDAVKYAVDGDRSTRWKSLVNQSPGAGIWFLLDLRAEHTLTRIVLHGNRLKASDYPRQLEVYVSSDPKAWGKPVVIARGKATTVEISIPPTRGRYLKLVSTGSAGNNWSIYEIELE